MHVVRKNNEFVIHVPLAQQLHQSAVVQHLTKSLGEEENADVLLDQIARPLMSVARMPEAIEQAAEKA